jgi:hypothetical protein
MCFQIRRQQMDGSGDSAGWRVAAGREPETRRARRVVVVLVGLLALWCAVPALAAAQSEWRLGGATLGESVVTGWTGSVKLTDGAIESAVKCEDTAEGSVTTGGAGEITKLTASKCAAVSGSCEASRSVTAEAVHLPWRSELVTVEGTTRMKLVSSGKGTPGFKYECKVLGVPFKDECTGPISATTTNVAGGVTATLSSSEKLSCDGGVAQGSLEGVQSGTSLYGKLSAVTAAQAEELSSVYWLLSGVRLREPINVQWKGTVTPRDEAAAVSCEDTAEGTAGSGVGTVTKWSMSNCVPKQKCEGAVSAEAIHLPWRSELVDIEGVIHNVLLGSGKGAAGYKWKCKLLGISIEETCTGVLSSTTPPGREGTGVTLTFDASEKFDCGGVQSGTVEGSQKVEALSGGYLGVS